MTFATRLPVDDFRDQIEEAVERHPVVILSAETGAGKSTRVPFWLWQRGKKVHVTQPRRIAARALSYYLAHNAGCAWGAAIGFQTGLDSKKSAETTLLYLTDGVQMAQEIKGHRDYQVLVLDEIHEWNLNQEVLIGLVRENLEKGFYQQTGRRVLVMSATLKAKQTLRFPGGRADHHHPRPRLPRFSSTGATPASCCPTPPAWSRKAATCWSSSPASRRSRSSAGSCA